MCVGPLDRDPGFVDGLRRRAETDGLADRIWFAGARSPRELDREYAAADVVVHASYAETFGMVVIEALARGLPVIAAGRWWRAGSLSVARLMGGVPAFWCRPGTRTHSASPSSSWLNDADVRRRLRRAAHGAPYDAHSLVRDHGSGRACAEIGWRPGVVIS